ncbi:MAG TPA: energy-coupling factor ABC transporter permease [Phycisphaerae bacterium]|nr:energy-coupling factor ABC transporter permease [Phycisphaerae bacterium]
MHIASGFLSPPVWGTMAAVSGAALAGSLAAARRQLDDRKVPLMGVMGAFVFAAQMVNFPILSGFLAGLPIGTSGHLGGGFLLGVLLGPALGIVAMASVLVIQALVFQDGGVEALGANIFTMGVFPCILGGVVRGLWRKPSWLSYTVTFAGAAIGVLAGATLVILLLDWSVMLPQSVSLLQALGVMDSVHLFIGLVEGAITVAVVRFVLGARREVVFGTTQLVSAGEVKA